MAPCPIRTLTRVLRNRKVQWIIAIYVVIYFACLFTQDRCEIYRHPSYHGNINSTTTDNFMSRVLSLAGYQEITTADVEDFVKSGTKLKEFVFILNSQVCRVPNDNPDVFLLVVVPSKPSNYDERQTIRDTWGSRFKKDSKNKLVFLTGIADYTTNDEILKEQEMHLDIVQALFVDSYKNLTLKVVSMLQWKKQFCPQAKFLLKIDDDVFLQTDNLLSTLTSLQDEERFILGHTDIGNIPYRNPSNKWHITYEEYPYQRFPTFSRGSSYVISSDLVEDLYNTARHKSRIHLEDVYVTGLCAHIARASHVGRCGFNGWRNLFVWLTSETVVTAYDYTPSEMRALWGKLESWKNWIPLFKSLWRIVCLSSFI